MKHADFVHLHNHSDYSLLDGASRIPPMVARAAALKMPALALTDHGAMFGAIQFYQEARKAGVKPIVGMEAYVSRVGRKERVQSAHHLVLLARDEEGFHNLMRLSSLAYLEGMYYKPRVDHEILSKYSKGLLALSACPQGEIAADLLADKDDDALKTAMMYRDIFGAENYFLEIQNHGLDIEVKIREKVKALARKTGLPLVATNDCHYLEKHHTDAQDVLICIQTGKTVDIDPKQRMSALAELHFRTPEEMRAAFPDCPEALLNTVAVAERCNLQMSFGKPLLPEFPLPEGWTDADAYFRDLAWKELHARLGHSLGDAVKQRFAYELDVICKMGFASYFLIVRDFIFYAKSHGIGVGPGRGSVAGSLVAYALRITDVDPLKHDLIFERFLNPERVTMPDIDIDFDDLRRGEVIEYVKRKYGETNVTQIITFGTMGAKGVVRDVGRALGFPVAEVDRIAKLVPDGLNMTLDEAIKQTPELRDLPAKGGNYARLLESAKVLEGLSRHASTHAAGVLITPGPLLDYVPLYRQKDGSHTTQWDMKSVEKAGLLKMDFLGLRTLSVLDEGVRLVKQHHDVEVDWQTLGLDDPAAYKVFADADTVAIFQFESTGMREYLRKLKPTVFEDLVAMNALYRPGPMENIPYFIDCKHGRQVAKYDHASLEPILKGTYGVFVYQEQVMAAANRLAGFSMAQADELRRAMGKKNVEEMDKKRVQFVEGCAKHSKIQPKVAEKIFATMQKFAGYGFNKSHSAAYALVAYQCAYLKAHYPAEFMAATMTSEMSDSARIMTLIEEAKRMGIAPLPPDVNCSNWKFSIEDGRIRVGLGAVRNTGQGAIEAMLRARDAGGAFHDLYELASRTDAGALNRRVLESLVASGACDALGGNRASLFAGAALALEHAAAVHRERESGQSNLFGGGEGGVAVSAPTLPALPDWPPRETSAKEKEVLGFYLSGHPLEHVRDEIARIAPEGIVRVLEQGHDAEARVVGIVSEIKQITTKAGKLMAMVVLEDLSGRAECTLFPEAYEQARPHLAVDAIVVASGRVEVRDDRGPKLLLNDVRPWEQGRADFRPVLQIKIEAADLSMDALQGIGEVLDAFPGESDVYLLLSEPGKRLQEVRSRRWKVRTDDALLDRLKQRVPVCRVRWGKGSS